MSSNMPSPMGLYMGIKLQPNEQLSQYVRTDLDSIAWLTRDMDFLGLLFPDEFDRAELHLDRAEVEDLKTEVDAKLGQLCLQEYIVRPLRNSWRPFFLRGVVGVTVGDNGAIHTMRKVVQESTERRYGSTHTVPTEKREYRVRFAQHTYTNKEVRERTTPHLPELPQEAGFKIAGYKLSAQYCYKSDK